MKKILIFIVTYNAEKTIESVLTRIPSALFDSESYETEILIIDDASKDATVERSKFFKQSFKKAPLHILKNKNNLGYGGNQKLGYRYGIDRGFDVVALVHGDGQYAPEELPRLLEPFFSQEKAVFGSRMSVPGAALSGGMPLYKYVGNKFLTFIQNKIARTKMSEYHSGYRLYSTEALRQIPFEKNSDGFDFDTDIILQLHSVGIVPKELPVPTFYGDEICYVNISSYARRIILSCLVFRLQDLGLAYHPKFEIPRSSIAHYKAKFTFHSSHSYALDAVNQGESLLILGAGSTELIKPFSQKSSYLRIVDQVVEKETRERFPDFVEADLDNLDFSLLEGQSYDSVLLLDVIEHLKFPDLFFGKLSKQKNLRQARFVISTANVAFFSIRLALLFGSFNYSKKGILDLTHFRLFTFSSLKKLLLEQGFEVLVVRGVPAPFALIFGENLFASFCSFLNRCLIALFRSAFSYQMLFVVKRREDASSVLEQASS